MPEADLSDAVESLAWADNQIDLLAREIASFNETSPYTVTIEKGLDDWSYFYMSIGKTAAKKFSPTVNSIIQAQRSSLDYLAVALAEANGARNPADTYFPIAKSKEGFSDKRTLRKIRKLHASHQDIIRGLEPFAGGNDALYALHALNIERKHRRLGVLAQTPTLHRFGGGPARLFQLIGHGPIILSEDRNLVLSAQFDGVLNFEFDVDIAFCSVPGLDGAPSATQVLKAFSSECQMVIGKFGDVQVERISPPR